MIDQARDIRRGRLDNILRAERDDAFAVAFKSGLDALDSHVRFTVGVGPLSARAQTRARTAFGLLMSGLQTAMRDDVITSDCAAALSKLAADTLDKLVRDLKGEVPW